MVDLSPAGVARIEDSNREYGQKCRDRMGADFLAGMDTLTTARDMDAVRAALGSEQLNFLGFSYGTRPGCRARPSFSAPARAGCALADQNVDPVEELVGQTAAFQEAFDTYAADCAKSPACPLGTDPAQFVNRYHQLVEPLVAKPGPTADPRGLSYPDAIEGTNAALYSPDDWQALTDGLTALAHGAMLMGCSISLTAAWTATTRGTTAATMTRSTRSTVLTRRFPPIPRCGQAG